PDAAPGGSGHASGASVTGTHAGSRSSGTAPLTGATGSGSGGLPASAAPSVPAPPPGPADGVVPGSANPAVGPFGTNGGGFPSASGPVTVTYVGSPNHATLVRDYAMLALAALFLAVATHLLWIRRQSAVVQHRM
ncbi:MAG TPA: hypothetical protein VGR90_04745, partial [Acidimicrobiales bacterium]|nr:hypothetical protein [Acidimicrobiales bacterium]